MSNKTTIKFDGVVVRPICGRSKTIGLMNNNASKFLNWEGELESLGSEDIFVDKYRGEICSLTFVEDGPPYAAFLEPALTGNIGMRVVNIDITYEEFLGMEPDLESDDNAIEVEESVVTDTDKKNNDNDYVFDYVVYVGRNAIGLCNEGSRTYLTLSGRVALIKKTYAVKSGMDGVKHPLHFISENRASFIDNTKHFKYVKITKEGFNKVKDLLDPSIEKSLYADNPNAVEDNDTGTQHLRCFDYIVIDENGIIAGLANDDDRTLILTPGGNIVCSKHNSLTFASIGEPVSLKADRNGVVYYDTAPKDHPLHEYNRRFIMTASISKFEKAFNLLDNAGELEEYVNRSPFSPTHFPMFSRQLFPQPHPSAGIVPLTGQQMLCNPPKPQPHAGGNFDLRNVQMSKPSDTNVQKPNSEIKGFDHDFDGVEDKLPNTEPEVKVFGDHDGYVSEEAAKTLFGSERLAGFYRDSDGVADKSSSVKSEIKGFDHDFDGVEDPAPAEETKPAHSDLVCLNQLTRKLENGENLYLILGYKPTKDGNIVPEVSSIGHVVEHDTTGEIEVYARTGLRLTISDSLGLTVDNLYVIK